MPSIGSLRNALSAEQLTASALPEDTDSVDGVRDDLPSVFCIRWVVQLGFRHGFGFSSGGAIQRWVWT